MRLVFHVQGSAPQPYRVTAEGEGEGLRMFCTCPSGATRAGFCKHMAALLMGDVTALRAPSDSVETLALLARGSEMVGRALRHKPAQRPDVSIYAGLVGLDDLERAYGAVWRAAGWELRRIRHEGPAEEDLLGLHGRTKYGKPRVNPSVRVSCSAFATMLLALPDGDFKEVVTGPRQRPWTVRGPVGQAASFESLARAMPQLLRQIEAASR